MLSIIDIKNLLYHNGVKFQPTCIGSLTDCLGIIPGALRPTRNRWLEVIGPAPSIGLPKASTTRPKSSVPTGTSTMAPVRLTTSPSLISLSLPKMGIGYKLTQTDFTFLRFRRK